jgi:hypothetical protein
MPADRDDCGNVAAFNLARNLNRKSIFFLLTEKIVCVSLARAEKQGGSLRGISLPGIVRRLQGGDPSVTWRVNM